MNKDRFVPIKGYEGFYRINHNGIVLSEERIRKGKCKGYKIKEKIIKQGLGPNGYFHVTLYKDGIAKTFSVHRLLAETFIPNPHRYPCINHKDEDKRNNALDNLEWVTYSQNLSYNNLRIRSGNSLRNRSLPVLQISKNGEVIREFRCQSDAAEYLGTSRQSINRALSGKFKSLYGFIWKFKEAM